MLSGLTYVEYCILFGGNLISLNSNIVKRIMWHMSLIITCDIIWLKQSFNKSHDCFLCSLYVKIKHIEIDCQLLRES